MVRTPINMMRTKRAFLFSILTLILLTVMYIVVSGRFAVDQVQETASLGSRATLGTQMVGDLNEVYFSELLKSSMRKGLNEMAWHLNESVFLYENSTLFAEEFDTLVLYGRIGNESFSGMDDFAYNNLLNNLTNTINDLFGYEMDVSFDNTSLLYYHTSAWEITVHINLRYNLSGSEFAFMNKTAYVTAVFPIDGLVDPLVTAHAEDDLVRVIERQQVPEEWTFDALVNLSNSSEFTKYRPWPDAPTYLQRFTMNISADPDGFGIESFLSPDEVTYDLASENRIMGEEVVCFGGGLGGFGQTCTYVELIVSSFVDHVFFKNTPGCLERMHSVSNVADNIYNFTSASGLPSKFLLDHFRLQNYTDLSAAGNELLDEDVRVDLRCPT